MPHDVSFISAHGLYLAAELDDTLIANRAYTEPGAWETFSCDMPDPGQAMVIAVKSHHGKYVCAEGGGGGIVIADRAYDSPGPWETFTAVAHDTGKYAVLCHDGIHYVTAHPDGHIIADATAIGEWELWTITPDPWASRPGPPTPTQPGNRDAAGAVWLDGRICRDDRGSYLAIGASFFWAPRAYRDYRDRFDRNCAWLAAHGFTYYRALGTTGGWPPPDPWEYAGAFLPWALDVVPVMLDDAFTRYRLRCSLTLFDGECQTPDDASQDRYVADMCDRLLPRLHTVQDVQMVNEYGPTRWDYPEGIARMRRHATTCRSRLGDRIPISLSSRNTAMNDGAPDDVYAECHRLFDGLVPHIVNVTCNHDSRETHMIDEAWRHVRQGWERCVHDPSGKPLEPDASIDDEPMGPRSSVAEEDRPSLILGKMIVDFISGRHQYCYHADAGIWSNLLNPPQRGMGEFALIEDHPASAAVGAGVATLLTLLPPDLPMWTRTRHGFTDHPFAASFKQHASGGFSQIWPDQVTSYGVVRAYAALRGNDFVCALTGVRDHIVLTWVHAMTFTVYACATMTACETITSAGHESITIPEAIDTDLVVIGRFT
jgi:hypothetical protein